MRGELSNVQPSRSGWRPLLLAAAVVVATGSLAWAAVNYAAARAAMVNNLRRQSIRNERVLAAMSRVPRHEFVDRAYLPIAYAETEVPTGSGWMLNSPLVVARMTQALDPGAKAKVLTVGCGGGYQAAVLSVLSGRVFAVERQASTVRQVRGKLQALGYREVRVTVADGTSGWPAYAPYDAILVTMAVGHVPPKLVEQLADGGCLVAPIGRGPEQTLCRYKKNGHNLASESLGPIRLSTTLAQASVVP